ncbi:unnamed protein product [Echinostoma caproni]|uniref:G_PROTEIN_RECEP_F1_2 domain-containing protein n=1 Tax=Echinostoma caproni TaxID=27848 RepID=A0A183AFV6_9TREM|nr:unnamed protein product [Echinostoma caproni]
MNAIRVALAVFGLIGTGLNTIVLYVLFKVRIGSRMTTVHMRCQCVLDGYTCFITFLYKVIGASIVTGLPGLDAFLCVVWFQDNLIWIGIIMSLLNIACVSLDRFVAVFFPVQYRLQQNRLLYFTFTYIILTGTVVFLPNFLYRQYRDGQCVHNSSHHGPAVETYLKYDAYSWLVLIYLIPISFMTVSHALIIYGITKRMKHTTGPNATMKRLTVTTLLMASILILSHSYDLSTYTLASLKLTRYQYLSTSQQLGVLFIIWSSCLLPCVLASMNRSIRGYLHTNLFLCLRFCKIRAGQPETKSDDVFVLSNSGHEGE